jgi:hypothetical protein
MDKKYCAVTFFVILLGHLALLSMDNNPGLFVALKPELQKDIVERLVNMHRLQDPKLAKPNIPPFMFVNNISGEKCIIDSTKRMFYKPSTVDGVHSDQFPLRFDVYCNEHIRPTNLLIACLQKDVTAAQRLLKLYPLTEKQVVENDPQSQQLYNNYMETKQLFIEALCASKAIQNNKTTDLLLQHLKDAGLSEDLLIEMHNQHKADNKQELHEYKKVVAQDLKNCYQKAIFNATGSIARDKTMEFSAEEEKKARKEFEEMILGFTKD